MGALEALSARWRGVSVEQEASLTFAGRRSKSIDARCPKVASPGIGGARAAGKDGYGMAVNGKNLTGLDKLVRIAEVAESDRGSELSSTNFYAALKGGSEGFKGLAAADLAAALDHVRRQAVDENAGLCEAAGKSVAEATVLGELCGLLSKVSEAAEAHAGDAYACVSAVGGDRGVEPAGKALVLALAPTIRAAADERDRIAAAAGQAEGAEGEGAGEDRQRPVVFLSEPPEAFDDSAAGAAFVMAALEDEDEPIDAEGPSPEPGAEVAPEPEEEPEVSEPAPAPVAAPAPAREKSQDMAALLADVLSHAEAAIGLDVELTVAQYAEVYGIDGDAESIRRHLGSRIAAYCKLGKL